MNSYLLTKYRDARQYLKRQRDRDTREDSLSAVFREGAWQRDSGFEDEGDIGRRTNVTKYTHTDNGGAACDWKVLSIRLPLRHAETFGTRKDLRGLLDLEGLILHRTT